MRSFSIVCSPTSGELHISGDLWVSASQAFRRNPSDFHRVTPEVAGEIDVYFKRNPLTPGEWVGMDPADVSNMQHTRNFVENVQKGGK